MKIKNLIIFTLLFNLTLYSQKNLTPFEGILVYKITTTDTSLTNIIPPTYMVVATNDTLVRIENTSMTFGDQIVIKHTILNKSYLLIDTGKKKYAIQTDRNKQNTTVEKIEYELKRKREKITICNLPANKLVITNPKTQNSTIVYYYKNYSNKYIDAYNESPGLPVLFFLDTPDGQMKYELIEMTSKKVNKDLFGIPSDYQKTTFEDFMNELVGE